MPFRQRRSEPEANGSFRPCARPPPRPEYLIQVCQLSFGPTKETLEASAASEIPVKISGILWLEIIHGLFRETLQVLEGENFPCFVLPVVAKTCRARNHE